MKINRMNHGQVAAALKKAKEKCPGSLYERHLRARKAVLEGGPYKYEGLYIEKYDSQSGVATLEIVYQDQAGESHSCFVETKDPKAARLWWGHPTFVGYSATKQVMADPAEINWRLTFGWPD